MNDLAKNLIVWVILAAILMSVFNSFTPQPVDNSLDYSDFVQEVQNERVSSISIDGLIIEGEHRDGSKFRTVRPNVQDPGLMDDLLNHNVKVVGKEPETPSLISQLLVAAFPILLILAIFVFFMRQMQGGGGGGTNVTVNVDASGNASVQGDQSQAKQLGVAVSAAVQAELVKQQRPGGILAGTRR